MMNDDIREAIDTAAQRLAAAFRPQESDLTIKLLGGVIESVGANHSTAIVKIGDSKIRALNKSGDKLMAGESVWLGYIKSLADAVIVFRTGLSIPPGGGGGGDEPIIGDITIRSNGTYRAEASGYDGFGVVEVDVPTVTPQIGQIDKAIVDGVRMTMLARGGEY